MFVYPTFPECTWDGSEIQFPPKEAFLGPSEGTKRPLSSTILLPEGPVFFLLETDSLPSCLPVTLKQRALPVAQFP